MFILNILSKSRLSIIPEFIPSFETRLGTIDENKYWKISNEKLKKFNLNNDRFKKMFEKQLNLKHRHTINFDHYPFKNKMFNDYR